MVAASTAPGVDQQVINVGSGKATSIRELVRMVKNITGTNPEVVYNPRTDRGPDRMCADLALAREKLGYQPSIPLETGLQLTLDQDPRLRI
jgi:UDP-glucose 4-epimerase